MLSYDPRHDDQMLYLFDASGREHAINQLASDIPRVIAESGDVRGVHEFYANVYNLTPAHRDDVHRAIMENSDLEVITPDGGQRRRANAIKVGDTLRLKNQKSFFPIFGTASPKGRAT